MKKESTARLWVWWNRGFVRITVRAGQPVRLAYEGACDEGFEVRVEHFTMEAKGVQRKVHQMAGDCDGLQETFAYHTAALDRCATVTTGVPGIRIPDWSRTEGFIDRFGNLLPWVGGPMAR